MTIFDKKSGKVLWLAMTGTARQTLKPEEMTPTRLRNARRPVTCVALTTTHHQRPSLHESARRFARLSV
jgi:hypothetical protein